MIQRNTSRCHVGTLRLDFKPGQMCAMIFRLHQKRNDTRPCPEIQQPVILPCMCKSSEQDGIHAKTEFLGILDDLVAVPL